MTIVSVSIGTPRQSKANSELLLHLSILARVHVDDLIAERSLGTCILTFDWSLSQAPCASRLLGFPIQFGKFGYMSRHA